MYTHKISYTKTHKIFGTVTGSFKTTSDAVSIHMENLNSNKDYSNIVVEIL